MRALLFLWALSAPAQVLTLTVLGFNAEGKQICAELGRLANEPGVVETARPCFVRAERITARTHQGTELQFQAVRGEDVARGRLLLGFHLPTTGTEMLFSAKPIQVQTRKPETLAAWRAGVDPIAEGFVRAALPLYERGNPTAAIAQLKQAVARIPNFAEAWYLLGLSYDRVGNANEKIKALEKTCQLDPAHVTAARHLVVSYLLEKRQLEAQALVLDMQKTSPFVASQLQNTINVFKLESEISGLAPPGPPLKSPQ
jgi:tetratricopeptide (TPR) repeat protein